MRAASKAPNPKQGRVSVTENEYHIAGPTGKVLLLPENTNLPIICVATGTGIAPFRSFWRRLFYENVPSYKFGGLFWLFMGVANRDSTLYDDELKAIAATNPQQFRVDYALSREQNNRKGGKMYIQDKMEEYADEIFGLLDQVSGVLHPGWLAALAAPRGHAIYQLLACLVPCLMPCCLHSWLVETRLMMMGNAMVCWHGW